MKICLLTKKKQPYKNYKEMEFLNMNDFQTAIMLKILQFIMDGLSLFIFIYLSNIQNFIKNKQCFNFYIINILT